MTYAGSRACLEIAFSLELMLNFYFKNIQKKVEILSKIKCTLYENENTILH